MRHFICVGSCEGESSNPGTCQAEECKKEGEPLVPCNCEDGLHQEAKNASSQKEDEA